MLQVPSISQESCCPDRWKQSKNIYSHSVMMETKLKGAPSLLTYQWGSVSWYVVVQAPHKPGEAKIRYFTDQVGVDQHVPGRQVSVNKVSLREVTHPCSNSPEHPDKLEDTELTFVLLKKLRDMMEKKKSPVWCNMCRNSWQCVVFPHPEEGIQGPVLHELSDDPLWRGTGDNTL